MISLSNLFDGVKFQIRVPINQVKKKTKEPEASVSKSEESPEEEEEENEPKPKTFLGKVNRFTNDLIDYL